MSSLPLPLFLIIVNLIITTRSFLNTHITHCTYLTHKIHFNHQLHSPWVSSAAPPRRPPSTSPNPSLPPSLMEIPRPTPPPPAVPPLALVPSTKSPPPLPSPIRTAPAPQVPMSTSVTVSSPVLNPHPHAPHHHHHHHHHRSYIPHLRVYPCHTNPPQTTPTSSAPPTTPTRPSGTNPLHPPRPLPATTDRGSIAASGARIPKGSMRRLGWRIRRVGFVRYVLSC